MAKHVPFNIFQRLVRTWDRTHPYNAVQALRLDRSNVAPVECWQSAWPLALADLKLGRAVITANGYHHDTSTPPPPVQVRGSEIGFVPQIIHELNQPFDDEFPFRSFVQIEGDVLNVAIVYQHWAADSVSIRMLLQRWFERAMNPAAQPPLFTPSLATGGYWHHFGPDRLPWTLDSAFAELCRSFTRFRRVRRLRNAGGVDHATGFLIKPAAAGLVTPLRQYAHDRGLTIHDLFSAAALIQCDRHLPHRLSSARRDLALGTIVDLRPLHADALRDKLGLFLGFTNVIVRPTDLADFDRLLKVIHAQNQRHKDRHNAAAGMLWLTASLIAARFLPSEKAYRFYRKHMPLAGGISNVNLASSWAAMHYPQTVRQYVRVSPTGPMIPVAFTPTTLGDDLHLAMTYRQSLISDQTAHRMADGFLNHLRQLIGDTAH